ncbi:MAG TPA: DUF952 domain-containing protein [Anaerolineaceae bacterium]
MIYHIATKVAWIKAQQEGQYTAPSLSSEGFIHCSTIQQVLPVANLLFHGQKDIVLLHIDEKKLSAPLKYDPVSEKQGERFPHIYGAINLDAVLEVSDFREDERGGYRLP